MIVQVKVKEGNKMKQFIYLLTAMILTIVATLIPKEETALTILCIVLIGVFVVLHTIKTTKIRKQLNEMEDDNV
jgi:predicted aspartyl protease